EPLHTVAVVLVVLAGVDAALRSDAVRAAWRVLEAQTHDAMPELGQAGRCRSAREARADHQHGLRAPPRSSHEREFALALGPGPREGAARRQVSVQTWAARLHGGRAQRGAGGHRNTPSARARGVAAKPTPVATPSAS